MQEGQEKLKKLEIERNNTRIR